MDTERSYHFAVMRRAIDLLDAAEAPLPLDELAGAMGMSAAHFQRLFSQWAGVSPKRYQQYLQLGQAKAMLRDGRPVLEVAGEVGLSGPGRLHDLVVRWEAMTPGAYARAGEGLRVRWGVAGTAFGPAVAMATEHGLCGLGFAAEQGVEQVAADLAARWPRASFARDDGAVAPLVEEAFGVAGGGGRARLHAIGAPFQIKVWEALLAIPSGQVTTYGAVAGAVGRPRAVRAVGTAVGRNPLSWLIPCHRALRKGGALGGYHWGLPVKRAMLAWEAARAEAGDPAVGQRAA